MLDIQIDRPARQIEYPHGIFLIGSCFTEHIGDSLAELRFQTMQNPNGILFDPRSVAYSLQSYIDCVEYAETDLFLHNELWHSWEHHSRFSHTDRGEALRIINHQQTEAHHFLKRADWVIVTLGSAFNYTLTELAAGGTQRQPVANCHRAPAQWFNKNLLPVDEIVGLMDGAITRLFSFNAKANVILTVSPVRHIRDGVVNNNRSKARLIESVHELTSRLNRVHYFPAYELVIDVLRDYRFYDVDLVHPNYQATQFVFEKFVNTFMSQQTLDIMDEIRKVSIARKHKPFQPNTKAHQQFLQSHRMKVEQLKTKYPFLSLDEELDYFSRALPYNE